MATGHEHGPLGGYIVALVGLFVIFFAVPLVYNNTPQVRYSRQLYELGEELEIFVIDGDDRRQVFTDTLKWYCQFTSFAGGANPDPYDLAIPRGPIHYYFFEDIENKSLADNYRDLIIGMNHVIIDEELYVVIVFFGEGGYGKEVYLHDTLLYNYTDANPESNYGISLIKVEVEINKDVVLTPVDEDKPITDSMLMAIVGAAGAQ